MSPLADPPERLLHEWLAYLRLLARWEQLDGPFRGKVDLSGVVQETWLAAYQALAQVQPLPAAEQAAWLRRVFANNVKDEIRKYGAEVRNAYRERSLDAALADSSARLAAGLAADQSSPSQQAIAHEQLLRLAWGLEQLPEDQRQAMESHLRGSSLAEIADLLAERH